jgi:hypothetical protein
VNTLDALIYGVRKIFFGGVEQTTRDAVAFEGDAVSVVDDPIQGRTRVIFGGVSQAWVEQNMIDTRYADRLDIPSLAAQNPPGHWEVMFVAQKAVTLSDLILQFEQGNIFFTSVNYWTICVEVDVAGSVTTIMSADFKTNIGCSINYMPLSVFGVPEASHAIPAGAVVHIGAWSTGAPVALPPFTVAWKAV